MTTTFSDRLRYLQGGLSERSFAHSIGISNGAYRALLAGGAPTLGTLLSIINGTGCSLEWLATGRGEPRKAESAVDVDASSQVPALPLDEELFAHVFDRVVRTYKEAGVRLPMGELAKIALRRYPEIAAFGLPREEWQPILDLLALRLMREIEAAAAEPGSGKARA